MSDERRRWAALVFIGLAALLGTLDKSVVAIALPSAQAGLGFSDAQRQWVFTAGLVAVGLVLLGGRLADYLGRKRVFLAGLAGFVVAAALAGTATGLGQLVLARVLYGLASAAVAPAALSLLIVMFTDARDRGRAMGVYYAIMGSGAALGLVLGGVLAQFLSWRWCFLISAPIGVIAAVGGWLTLSDDRPVRKHRLDLLGAALSTTGLVALGYGCAEAVSQGWSAPLVLGSLAAALVLLAWFVARQSRVAEPLLPLRIILARNQGGAYLAMTLTSVAMLGLFLFLSYHLQVVLGYSPLLAGIAFLPLSAATQIGSVLGGRLQPHVAPRVLISTGLVAAAAAMLLLTRLEPGGSYLGQILPPEILLGIGVSCVFVSAINTATSGVAPADSGIASAMVSTATNTGGAFGTALLSSIAAAATSGYLASTPSTAGPHGSPPTDALVHGFAVAATWAAAIFALTAVLTVLLVNTPAPGRRPARPHANATQPIEQGNQI